jgi:hypothetical protein
MLLRSVLMLTVVLLPLLGSPSIADTDPIQEFDEQLVGAAVAHVCAPTFDWNKRRGVGGPIGRRAYEKLLADLRAESPHDADNENRAQIAFARRLEEGLRKGERLVTDKGCSDSEVQRRLKEFEAGN